MKKLMTLFGLLALAAMTCPRPASALTYARSVTANFHTAVATGAAIALKVGESFTYSVVNGADPNVNTAVLEYSCDGSNFKGFDVAVSTKNNSHGGTYTATIPVPYCPSQVTTLRFHETVFTSGASSTTITEVDNIVKSERNNQGESVVDIKDGGTAQNGYLTVLNSSVTASGFFGNGAALTGQTAMTLASSAVGTAKLATDSVTNAAILNASVDTPKISTVVGDSGKILASCGGVAMWRTGGTCP